MMGFEEQKEEREVLDSIFPDEITDISDTAYRVSIALEVTKQDDNAAVDPPTILLNVSYPNAYPDVPPNLDISSPPNAPRHPLLDVSEDRARLLDSLEATIEENIGMAMVFTLVTTLKDSAELLMIERQAQAQAVKDVEARQAEEVENRKFHGTAVTRERFLQWRQKFVAEMAEEDKKEKDEKELEEKKRARGKVEERKLTGKQLWERGLVGKIEEDDVVDGEDVGVPIETLKVEA